MLLVVSMMTAYCQTHSDADFTVTSEIENVGESDIKMSQRLK